MKGDSSPTGTPTRWAPNLLSGPPYAFPHTHCPAQTWGLTPSHRNYNHDLRKGPLGEMRPWWPCPCSLRRPAGLLGAQFMFRCCCCYKLWVHTAPACYLLYLLRSLTLTHCVVCNAAASLPRPHTPLLWRGRWRRSHTVSWVSFIEQLLRACRGCRGSSQLRPSAFPVSGVAVIILQPCPSQQLLENSAHTHHRAHHGPDNK